MKLKLWIAGYLAVAAVAIVGVWLDCFSYSLLIVLGLILWIAPDAAVILTIRRFRKGRSNDPPDVLGDPSQLAKSITDIARPEAGPRSYERSY
jgi:hypothetical protein